MSDRVDLPLSALAGVVARENLGSLHLALQPEPLWLPGEERERAGSAVHQALVEAGVVDGRGRLAADFLDLLPLLTSASVEYYGWFTVEGETWSVLGAARGVQGVLAVRSGDWVALAPADRGRLAELVVDQLPEAVAGGGTPRSVRASDLERAAARDHGALPEDVRQIVTVVRRPVAGSGELYVAERDELGHYRKLARPLHYVDTDWGRYLNYTTGDDDAEIHIAPGTRGALAATLERLRGSLAPG
ncbi:ESAT-6 protein secretion system EspG family protein [Prauserella shujinwangii]|uniref:ESAT-6 protein secretion system EspG family protein n=1 Tax=Prauserella shujinwangii TaxID=1453103 RepID=A0A2T0LY62_9PSEU|nr:ESX secretion-associated protein EspG [Prauserella shujinwangii]PRX49063.1 ESAT-6 protein secretion system EspG family protein [Prauserella shujinwangii]